MTPSLQTTQVEAPRTEPPRTARTCEPGPTESIFNLQRAVFESREETEPTRTPTPAPDPATAPAPTPIFDLDRESVRNLEIMRRDCPERVLHSFRQLRGRLLRRSAELTGLDAGLRTVFVTSPDPGLGKSFVARNLAVMTGVIPDCRVLLAEANPSRPAISQLLGLSGQPGVRDSFSGHAWQDISRRIPGLDVFVAGIGNMTPDAIDPFDARLMDRFRRRIEGDFDWLILDGPSLNESSDAEMLSHLADLTVVVLRPGSLGCRELARCLSRLNPAKVAGFVFNRPR